MVNAFTIDPKGTYTFDDALSIERCSQHENCDEIGIHIIASALSLDKKIRGLQFTKENVKKLIRNRRPHGFHSFENGRINIAVSLYSHTRSKDVSDPILTPVMVKRNYTLDQIKGPNFEKLWNAFVGEEIYRKIMETNSFLYLFQGISCYKVRILVEQIMFFYSRTMMHYLARRLQPPYVVRTSWNMLAAQTYEIYKENEEKNNLISQKNLEKCKSLLFKNELSDHFSCLDTGSCLLSSLRVMNPHSISNEDQGSVTIERAGQCIGKTLMYCTSPARDGLSLAHQQILLWHMLGNSHTLYSQADLWGLMLTGDSLNTPTLLKGYVRRLWEEYFSINFFEVDHSSSRIQLITYKGMGCNEYTCVKQEDKKKITSVTLQWKGMENANIEWETTVILQPKCLEEFITEWKLGSGNRNKMKNLYEALEAGSSITESPFKNHEVLKLTLKRGIILNFQMDKEDMANPRLLKFGPDCHVCLAHLWGNGGVFGLRKDLKEIVNYKKLADIFKKRKTFKASHVQIKWIGDYNSEGFLTADDPLEVGDLLCLRREINTYVGVAHAVVVELGNECGGEKANVKFSVCQLCQTVRLPEGRYLMEILKDETSEAIPKSEEGEQ